MADTEITEVEGVDLKNIQGVPFSGIKVIGGIHVGLGIVCMVLGAVNIVTYIIVDGSLTFVDQDLEQKQKLATKLAISSTPIWSGIWFCMCGAMALSISQKHKSSIYFFMTSFMILSILCSAVFGPACLGVNAYEALLRHGINDSDYKWIIPLLTSFFAFNEIIFAIISAVICCCCTPLEKTKIRVLLATDLQRMEKQRLGCSETRLECSETRLECSETRPSNPHLQREFRPGSRNELFSTSSQQEHPPMFKSASAYVTTGRFNFTRNHLRYNNGPNPHCADNI